MLPGVLLKNNHNRFICRTVKANYFGIKPLNEPLLMDVAVAHGEGRYFADDETIATLQCNNQILLSYQDIDDHGCAAINGSKAGIAGIVGGRERNVIGMMPHPERCAEAMLGNEDGRLILASMVEGFKKAKHAEVVV